jgi:tRNA (guanine-N7-)-methyltransferase
MQNHRTLQTDSHGLDPETLPKPIDWKTLFGNDRPVEIEIGSGKGTFLVNEALKRPEVNFLGIEWARWFYRYTADRLRRRACDNARAIRAEAGFFLDEFVPAESVSTLHIYFPDPWPKARHHKRRLVSESFMPKAHRILRPGGLIQIVTDHVEYWEQIERVVRASAFEVVEFTPPGDARRGEVVGSNFERKFIEEGRAFYAIAGRKRASCNTHNASLTPGF